MSPRPRGASHPPLGFPARRPSTSAVACPNPNTTTRAEPSPGVPGTDPEGPGCTDRWEEDTASGHQGRLVVHGRPLQALRVKPKKTQNITRKQKISMALMAGQSFSRPHTI